MPVEKESGHQTWAQKREGSLSNAISSEEESCPILSIYGNHFSIIRDHARYVLQDPSDVSKKITSLDVVLIDVLSFSSKAFYKDGYDENSEAMGPTCFSTNGIRPDASIETPQCQSCSACPARYDVSHLGHIERWDYAHPACYDFARVLVITCDDPYEAMILYVPASHIQSLSDYVHDLKANSTPYYSLITRVSFTLDQPKPQLTFKALKFLLAPEYENLRNRIKAEKEKWALSEDKSSPQQVNTLRKKAAILSERANGQLKKLGIEVQESNPSPKGLTYKEILAQQILQKILKIEEPQPIKTISG